MATNTNDQAEKFAIRKLFRLEDGTVGVFFIDAETGAILDDLEGYTLVTAGNLEAPASDADGDGVIDDQGTTNTRGRTMEFDSGGLDSLGMSDPFGMGGTAAREVTQGVTQRQVAFDESRSPGASPDPMQPGRSIYDEQRAVMDQNYYSKDTYPGDFGVKDTPRYDEDAGKPVGREVSYDMHGVRDKPSAQTTISVVDAAVKETLGPDYGISVTSLGQPSTGLARVGSPRHDVSPKGAIDFDVIGPDGKKVTDDATLDAVAKAAANKGIQGIGKGVGYMSPGRMHMDMKDPASVNGTRTWGAGGKKANADPDIVSLEDDMASYARFAKEDGLAPTPSPAPRGFADIPSIADYDPVPTPKEDDTISRGIIDNVTRGIPDDVDLNSLSPAEAAAYGATGVRSAAQVEAMARTLAGELGPNTLQGLREKDPVSIAEAASALATMENRMRSKAEEGVESTLRGSQYNANTPGAKAVTDQNYGLYQKDLTAVVDDFYAGRLQDQAKQMAALDATHYYNPDVVDPAWGGFMRDPRDIGDHRFDNLGPEDHYMPDDEFDAWAREVTVDRINKQSSNSWGTPDYGRASQGPNLGFTDGDGRSGVSAGPGYGPTGDFGPGGWASDSITGSAPSFGSDGAGSYGGGSSGGYSGGQSTSGNQAGGGWGQGAGAGGSSSSGGSTGANGGYSGGQSTSGNQAGGGWGQGGGAGGTSSGYGAGGWSDHGFGDWGGWI